MWPIAGPGDSDDPFLAGSGRCSDSIRRGKLQPECGCLGRSLQRPVNQVSEPRDLSSQIPRTKPGCKQKRWEPPACPSARPDTPLPISFSAEGRAAHQASVQCVSSPFRQSTAVRPRLHPANSIRERWEFPMPPMSWPGRFHPDEVRPRLWWLVDAQGITASAGNRARRYRYRIPRRWPDRGSSDRQPDATVCGRWRTIPVLPRLSVVPTIVRASRSESANQCLCHIIE